jgi:hypothetical protein
MSSRSQRAAKRTHWPIRAVDSENNDELELAQTTTPSQRLAMMNRLTLDAWALLGKTLPDYSRQEIPGTLQSPHDE